MKTILLVDDEEISNFIVKKYLGLFSKNTKVIEYTDSKDAFYSLAFQKPDLVFLDLNMPEFSGYDFLKKMKENNLSQKVIILTASPTKDDYEHAHQYSNVVGYFVKPLSDEDIKDIVENY